MKNIKVLIASMILIISCSKEKETSVNLDFSNLKIEGSFLKNPMLVDLKDYSLDSIFKDLAEELTSDDLSNHNADGNQSIEELIGIINLLIDKEADEAQITLTTETKNSNDKSQENSNWIYYGLCSEKDCMKQKLKEMEAELFTQGCMELRFKIDLSEIEANIYGREGNCRK